MGLVYADITLSNLEDISLFRRKYISEKEIRRIEVKSLVDSGAYMLVVPEHIKLQLGLSVIEQREVELADGKTSLCDIVGYIEIRFANRMAVCNAFVMGNEVLLGAIPMEELDVIIEPRNQRLIVNPENPTMPKMKIK
ncbi:MAG: clan AA aspartic protease [Desulfobacterales bacterium]|nr:clan AA aspartic protease [Desulfobacterales bacterium]